MPDITLLAPLANLLGVTITELLSGQYIREPENLNVREVEKLVNGTIMLSEKEERQRRQKRKHRGFIVLACAVLASLEVALLFTLGYSTKQLIDNILTIELLCFLFGSWICLFVKETLPVYYDENKIHTYSDGIFRMNMAGISFNNRNWPHILKTGRICLLLILILFPLLYLTISWFYPTVWNSGKVYFTLASVLGIFIPMIVAGKRYE